MKRKFTKTAAALALLAALFIPLGMRGQTRTQITWDASQQNYSNGQDVTSATFDSNISAAFEGGKYYSTGTAVRVYGGKTFTITASSNNTISEIAITFGSGDGNNTITANTGTYSNGTWTGSASSVVFSVDGTSGHRRLKAFAVTYSGGGSQPTTYTVTYNANGGTGTMTDANSPYNAGATVTVLGNEFTRTDYEFDHWNTAADDSGTSYDEDDTFTINANTTLYAQWTENTTPTPGGDVTTTYIFTSKSWGATPTDWTSGKDGNQMQSGRGVQVTTAVSGANATSPRDFANVSSIVVTYSTNASKGKGNIKVQVGNNTEKSVSITPVGTDDHTTTFTFAPYETGSVKLTVTCTENSIYIKSIAITETSGGSSLDLSDLAITNESTDLAFDLYNNSTDQVISYTTSSTGEITITPATSDYFTYVHDANAKTITVTPTAVTPSAQTVTINQAADENYYSGSASFTVSVANSTPLANIAELTAQTAHGEYVVTLSNAVVTFVDGSDAYIQDQSGAVLMHKSDHGLTAGDVLNGTATVAYQLYNANPQITDLSGVTPVAGTVPNPTEITASLWNYTFGDVLSQYFKITGVTITQSSNKYYISLGGESIQLYKAGTAISDLDLSKTYTVIGFPTLYNTTKEIKIYADPEPEASTEPAVTLQDYSIDVPAADGDGILTVHYENIEDVVADIAFYEADGETAATYDWITADLDSDNNIYYLVEANEGAVRTAYFKVYALVGEEYVYSNLITITQAAYVVDYATLPFAYDGNGTGDLPNGFTVYGTGTYSSSPAIQFNAADNQGVEDYVILHFNETPGVLTFDIKGNGFSDGTFRMQTSTDGINYTDKVSYTEIASTTETKTISDLASDVRYIKWSYTKVTGNVAFGNINLAAYVAPTEQYLMVTLSEGIKAIYVFDDPNGSPLIEEGGADIISVMSGTTIIVSPEVAEGYVFQSLSVLDDDNNPVQTEDHMEDGGYYTFTMPASGVTITATAAEAPQSVYYTLATRIENGRHYIITDGSAKAMGIQNNNNRAAIDVDISGDVATVNSNDVYEIVINGPELLIDEETGETTEVYTIYDARYVHNDELTGGFLYAASGSSNYLKTETHLDTDKNALWTIAFDSENHAVITAQGTNSRNLMRFNSQSNLFSCYGDGQQPIYLYVKDETAPQYDFYKDIAGYGTGTGKYYLITSPIDGADPEQVGMITDDNTNPENFSYDLYWFDQTQTEEWQNARQVESMSLVSGNLGYLYANKNNVTLHFTGTPNDAASVSLVKSDNDNVDWSGWNLVGNPLTVPAYINRSFYRMNEEGTELIEGSGAINPMEGIFVIANANDEEMTFGTSAPTNVDPDVVVNVTNDNKVIDRAVVRFNNGGLLPKFQLNPNNTKIYVTEGNKDYAVVRSAAEAEMPVSFRAAENGTYTLSVETKNVEMNYLHLIDNMTGADVDLLATPSYTFEANTTDYASRFRLVFSINSISEDADGANAFAYFNGSNWTVNNIGEATLQVVDVMGRVLSSETLSGNAEVNINQPTGVYMLRLVSGDSVKVQKVVVR